MNLFITPLLILGLLISPAPDAGECVVEPAATRSCESCAIKVSIPQARTDLLDRKAGKHADYYRVLMRAQQETGATPAPVQYSARAEMIAESTAQ